MKYTKILILLTSLLITYSCNSISDTKKNCKQKLEIELQIKIPYDFKIINIKSNSAIGDYSEEFTLSFSEKNYRSILKAIDSSRIVRVPDKNWYSFQKTTKENEFISITFDSDKSEITYNITTVRL